jgi:hypothetical protein
MSAVDKIEKRLAALEAEMSRVKEKLSADEKPWWVSWMGAFQDDPIAAEALELGRKWRQSQKAKPRKRKAKNDRA